MVDALPMNPTRRAPLFRFRTVATTVPAEWVCGLINIVKSVHQGESYVSPDLAARLLTEMKDGAKNGIRSDPLSDLTAREEQILKGVSRGLSNKEIGRELKLQEKTVKHYMTNVLQKLQVRNRVEAAIMAKDRFPEA